MAQLTLGSICVITLFRIIYTVKIDAQDVTKSYASVGILSLLEPLLGVINACLPFMKPILRKFTQAKMLAWTKGTGTGTSASGGSNVDRFKQFQRLDDAAYPLGGLPSSVPGHMTGVHLTGVSSKAPLDDYEKNSENRSDEELRNMKGIFVQREWDIERSA